MPTILGHALVAGTAYEALRETPARKLLPRSWWAGLLIALSCAPDLDVVMFAWVPYEHPLGHRGLWHAPLFAIAFTLGVAMGLRLTRRLCTISQTFCVWAILAVVMASHGLLDCLTDGGLGIALGAPFSAERFFAPVRPLPVSPIGPAVLVTPYGWSVLVWEALLFGPLWLAVRLARWRAWSPRKRAIGAALLITGCAALWVWRILC